MKTTKLTLIIALAGCFLCGNIFALTGAIFTTDSTCSGVDLNIYSSKGDVYLTGGPQHPGGPTLPDGSYYVRVTNPGGNLLLGTSVGSGIPRLLWSSAASCRVVLNSVALSYPVAIQTPTVVLMIRTTAVANIKSG